jgi:adenine-specific DNA-methyltransferase
MGSGTVALASALEGRRFAGCDIEKRYIAIAKKRIEQMKKGHLIYRPIEKPIYEPRATDAVAQTPAHFQFQSHHP